MSADALLDRLQRVRKTGPDSWIAACPAHEDRSPSLSIRELDDGRILLHDFAGCDVEAIVGAIGLELSDLFPDKPIEHGKRERRPFLPASVFEVVRLEIGIAVVIASDMHRNKTISEADFERLFVVVERLNDIAQAAYGR